MVWENACTKFTDNQRITNSMKHREFFDEVAKLRDLQKKYFKTRASIDLIACRKQEKKIDEEIVRVQRLVEPDGQLRL